MFDEVMLIALACLLFVCLMLTIAYFLYTLGVFQTVKVSVGKPVITNVWIAYKHYVGPYENCGPYFCEVSTLCPEKDCIGIYYDDPQIVPSDKLRYIVGVVLCEGSEKPPQSLVTLLVSRGYSSFQLPLSEYVVKAEFPYILNFSAVLGAKKVYPALEGYIKEHKLSAHPCIEFYAKNTIHYLAPLSKQSDFFPPEVEYNCQISAKTSPDETPSERGSQDANTTDEESQGTTSSFEEIVAEPES